MERMVADQAAAPEPGRGGAPPTREAGVPVPPARRRLRWGFVWGGALAAGLLALLVATAVSRRHEDRLHDLAREAATLRDDLARQQALLAILTDPATRIVALAGQPPSPGARARVLWHEQAGGILVAAGLPAPPPGKAYQLWALVPRRPPVPAGVFGVDARGVASLRLAPLVDRGPVEGFAVSLEPAGGLPAPSGPIYVAGRG
jgi:hypothetical protein